MRLEPNEPYLERLHDTAATIRVRSSLRRTWDGAPTDLISPLIPRSETPDEGRMRLRDELGRQVIPTGYDWLDEAEADQSSKIGAYSIMLPYVERRPDVEAYFARRSYTIDHTDLAMAELMTQDQLGLRNLRPISLQEAFEQMPVGTNLGAPFFTSDKRFRKNVLDLAREIERNGYQGWHVEHDPAILYWRGQPRGIGEIPKQRVVWGMPHWLTLFELQLQVPMLTVAKRLDEFASWVNQDRVNRVVSIMLRTAVEPILSVDFSKFDATLPAEVIVSVFNIIRGAFREEYWPLIDMVEDRFQRITLMTPDGTMSDRSGGVPSGSALTNWADSIGHKLMWNYVSIKLRNQVLAALFQGDDGAISFQREWNIVELEELFRTNFGMKVSAEKGGISREQVYFLQNIHSVDYHLGGINVNVRPIMRCLNGMMSYERLVKEWVDADDTLRWWQQAENCKYHPKFLELAKFLYKHDKYSRTLSAAEVLQKAGGWKRAESVLRQPSFPFGKASLSALANFDIVRALDALQHGQERAIPSHEPTEGVS